MFKKKVFLAKLTMLSTLTLFITGCDLNRKNDFEQMNNLMKKKYHFDINQCIKKENKCIDQCNANNMYYHSYNNDHRQYDPRNQSHIENHNYLIATCVIGCNQRYEACIKAEQLQSPIITRNYKIGLEGKQKNQM